MSHPAIRSRLGIAAANRQTVTVRLVDGSDLVGPVTQHNDGSISVATDDGTWYVPTDNILAVGATT